MALLAEGNPATEVAQGSSTGVPAATYLATLEQRSSDMTKTDQQVTTKSPGPRRGLAWALAALAVVFAVGGLYFAFSRDDGEVVDQTTVPTPTTVAPDVESMTDLEIIEAGAAAFYSGDAERAAALFELSDRTDLELRQESAYQAAVDGRVNLDCTESTPGTFGCSVDYGNALFDAAAETDDQSIPWLNRTVEDGFIQDYEVRVVVEDGVITDFMFPRDASISILMGSILAEEGRLEGYEHCVFGPLTESCAVIQMENLDALAEYSARRAEESGAYEAWKTGLMQSALNAWYGGDCLTAHFLAGEMLYVNGEIGGGYQDGAEALCQPSADSTQTIEYESILGAEATLDGCEFEGGFDWGRTFDNIRVYQMMGVRTCTVHYSNAMNTAVGKAPSATIRADFLASSLGLLLALHPDGWDAERTRVYPWHAQGAYPEDTELRESFKQYAESGELADEYAAADCANQRTPDCAHLIMDNLDDWAAWYRGNG
jgi:hypothetical protein